MKITNNGNTISVKAQSTAAAKMSKGFLARTTLAAWLNGSLGICSLLFATALDMAINSSVKIVTYGVITISVDAVNGNGYCKTVKATATALDCYGVAQTAQITVCYDYNGGNTARKKSGYIPAIKTEYGYRIKQIDGVAIDFDGVAINIK